MPDSIHKGSPQEQMPENFRQDENMSVLGLLLTYRPTLGIDDPEVEAFIRDGLRGDELRHALITRGSRRAYF